VIGALFQLEVHRYRRHVSSKAFDARVSAQQMVDFRRNTAPFFGSPYDERLCDFVNR
jgi:hypothetical protein